MSYYITAHKGIGHGIACSFTLRILIDNVIGKHKFIDKALIEIFKIAKVDCKVNPITTQQYPTPAKRPKNTLMSKDKIAEIFSVKIPDWKESLNTCMSILKEQK